jgi:hypothetical protein
MAEVFRNYRHKKSGLVVIVTAIARLQTAWPSTHLDDMELMVVYAHNNNTWVRSEREFDDGRFELLAIGE